MFKNTLSVMAVSVLSACGGGSSSQQNQQSSSAPTDTFNVQACLNQPTCIIEGSHIVYVPLIIKNPVSISGSGTLTAAASLNETMITASYTHDVNIQGITIDGNKSRRTCVGNYAGTNIHFDHVDNVLIDSITTRNAVCGSGFVISGNKVRITNSSFLSNGSHHISNSWADGLTLLHCDDCTISSNSFIDNTDVSFVWGGGRNSVVDKNKFIQSGAISFAAVAFDNFNGTQTGMFDSSIFTENSIECGSNMCDLGINVGPHAWYLSDWITNATVNDNTISGAKIGILIDGAAGIRIARNKITSINACGISLQFSCGFRTTCDAIWNQAHSSGEISLDKYIVGEHHLCP